MARKRPARKAVKGRSRASKAPDVPLPAEQQEHRDAVIDQVGAREARLRRRPEEMRLDMMRSIITEPLLSQVQEKARQGERMARFDVILSINELYHGGVPEALEEVARQAETWGVKYATVSHYCFASLTVEQILLITANARDAYETKGPGGSVIYRIWEDTEVDVTLNHSLATVKADAAQRAFQAFGTGIVWAVLDSGIQRDHPHFASKEAPFGPLDTLALTAPLEHMDFTPDADRAGTAVGQTAGMDRFGHGTHVAGIIAGYWASPSGKGEPVIGTEMRNEATNQAMRRRESLRTISGVAPLCKLVSMKVIADITMDGDPPQKQGQGKVSWVLKALDQIQKWNQHGSRLLVHGVNMSLGYEFDPRWFACGQSPLCVEVNRLVKTGVAVVVSAGNSGYSAVVLASGKSEARYNDLTITDPGNAEFAVTVGSTHKSMPHTYGVSYFSSRGPTGDGRRKPDLLAPGERIVSCAAGVEAAKYASLPAGTGGDIPVLYCEQTGTSMAAPHVSGAVAAFLSVRAEFIGQPERVKEIFMANCIDLKRDTNFQGAGLLDLMKTLQAI